jgi:hypothetical protein
MQMKGAAMRGLKGSQVAIAAVALAALFISTSFSAAQNRANVGTLTCRSNAAMSRATSLRQPLRCHFATSWGRLEPYSGIVTYLARNADLTGGGFFRWSVLMSGRRTHRGALVGRYIAEIGPGIGRKDLVGADRSIILRASRSANSSSARSRSKVNAAPEIAGLTIEHRRARRKR